MLATAYEYNFYEEPKYEYFIQFFQLIMKANKMEIDHIFDWTIAATSSA